MLGSGRITPYLRLRFLVRHARADGWAKKVIVPHPHPWSISSSAFHEEKLSTPSLTVRHSVPLELTRGVPYPWDMMHDTPWEGLRERAQSALTVGLAKSSAPLSAGQPDPRPALAVGSGITPVGQEITVARPALAVGSVRGRPSMTLMKHRSAVPLDQDITKAIKLRTRLRTCRRLLFSFRDPVRRCA